MQINKNIKIYIDDIASLAAEGRTCPVGTKGLYCTIMYARNSETKEERSFRGSSFYFEEDNIARRAYRLDVAIKLMVDAFKKSDIYNNGNCDIGNYLTGKWEKL